MHGPKCKLGNFCTVGRRLQEVNVLGGLILPVWGTIEKALSKQVLRYSRSDEVAGSFFSCACFTHRLIAMNYFLVFHYEWSRTCTLNSNIIAHNFCDNLQSRQSHKRLRVVRIETTTDNQRIVGLFVPNAAVESVLQGLYIFPFFLVLLALLIVPFTS